MKHLTLLACCAVLSLAALAQNGPTCTVTITDSNSNRCTGNEWLSPLTKCEVAKVSCPNFVNNNITYTFADAYLIFGYLNPTGTPKGTVLFFSEGGGETTNGRDIVGTSKTYAAYYNASPYNYQVVQTAWVSDWEDTGTTTKNIAYAAGRPAAFIQWVHDNLFTNSTGAGMCVQGASAGGAAAMYSVAWYGKSSIIDKISLLSSPPLSDIQVGCEVPGPPYLVQVCTQGPPAQIGCNSTNSPLDWTLSGQYVGTAVTQVGTWSGLSACAGSQQTTTSENTTWKQMSIVDGNVATVSNSSPSTIPNVT